MLDSKLKSFLSILMLITPLFVFGANSSQEAVGRIRFTDPSIPVSDADSRLDLDVLIMLGAPLNTQNQRIEFLDLHQNIYWLGENSRFHFESFDPQGDKTVFFLGSGSAIVQVEQPITLATSSGQVRLAANCIYAISKPKPGKKNVTISVVEGASPKILAEKKRNSRIEILSQAQPSALLAWQAQRKADWSLTLRRLKVFSNVSLMSPYLAHTASDGTLNWQKVSYIHPFYRAADFIDGNKFFLKMDLFRTSGMLNAQARNWTDFQIYMHFATNRFNAVKWDWNVLAGWHASMYYDPLWGTSAEFLYPPLFTYGTLTAPIHLSFAAYDLVRLGSMANPALFSCDGRPRYWATPKPRETQTARHTLLSSRILSASRPLHVTPRDRRLARNQSEARFSSRTHRPSRQVSSLRNTRSSMRSSSTTRVTSTRTRTTSTQPQTARVSPQSSTRVRNHRSN